MCAEVTFEEQARGAALQTSNAVTVAMSGVGMPANVLSVCTGAGNRLRMTDLFGLTEIDVMSHNNTIRQFQNFWQLRAKREKNDV